MFANLFQNMDGLSYTILVLSSLLVIVWVVMFIIVLIRVTRSGLKVMFLIVGQINNLNHVMNVYIPTYNFTFSLKSVNCFFIMIIRRIKSNFSEYLLAFSPIFRLA